MLSLIWGLTVSILDFLKPSPTVPEIEDQDELQKTYKYWRMRIFYGMYIGYVFYYFTRKSFTFAMPALMNDLGFDKSDLGILGSIFSISYGASKFISGMLSDRSNPRFFMGIGLILTGGCNLLFGWSSSIFLFAVFWGLNGWFQGFGWPPCARLLTHWYSQKERGTWWGVWNTSHNLGGALIAVIAAACAHYWGWRFSLFIPAFISIGCGFFLMNRLRDTPQSLGLPPIEKFKNDYSSVTAKDEESISAKQILFEHVLNNKYIWLLAISYFFVYVLRTAVNDWGLVFLKESKGYSMLTAGSCICWFEIGGGVGALAAGWFSDKILQGARGPVNILYCLAALVCVSALWFSPANAPILDSAIIFFIGFFVFGPQMLIGMVAAELCIKKAAGTATGFIGCIAYFGAAVAGYPVAKMTQEWGWQMFFYILAACCLIATAFLIPMWSLRPQSKKAPEQLSSEKEPVST
jgi:OPA family sugar phosphate sensor protein UhpC-like MFS transporter